jgi:Mn-dependent DtxR family transcriptional regulator
MSDTPAAYGQFGQALAFAERTLTTILRDHLEKRDTEPETWYALQLIATRGPGLAREELSSVLEGSPSLDADSTREVLARLEAEGLIQGDAHVDLTAAGAALHHSLREYISGPTTELLSQFDLHDIETTVHTLRAITERVAESATLAGHRGA